MIFDKLMEQLEAFTPAHLALSSDNSGYQIGRADKAVHKVCMATDATLDVIRQAKDSGADLLIAHHPIIFKPIARVTDDDFSGRRIIELIRSDINFVALHTNFDVAHMGSMAAGMLGLRDYKVFEVTRTEDAATLGIGCHGRLPRPMSLRECAEHVQATFKLDSLRVYGDGESPIDSAAISPGSTGLNAPMLAQKAGVDLYITGEIKHSTALALLSEGISVIEAGHFGTEKIFVPAMMEFFGREIPELEVFAAKESNPFYVL